jgi:hypothetical protein
MRRAAPTKLPVSRMAAKTASSSRRSMPLYRLLRKVED